MSVFLDLSEIKIEAYVPVEIKPGKYWVRCVEAQKKENSSKTGDILNCKFNFVDEALKGKNFYHSFNIRHESKKAQEIGLQELKRFLEAAGHGAVIEQMADLVGLVACAQLTTEVYKEKAQIKVKYFVTKAPEVESQSSAETSLFS